MFPYPLPTSFGTTTTNFIEPSSRVYKTLFSAWTDGPKNEVSEFSKDATSVLFAKRKVPRLRK